MGKPVDQRPSAARPLKAVSRALSLEGTAVCAIDVMRVRSVTLLDGFTVRLGFTDGSECCVDLGPYLEVSTLDSIRRDPTLFARVRVDAARGRIVWPDGEEIAPEVLVERCLPR